MNLLIVTQYFWPENFRINDVALGLKERGHEVTVLTGLPNYPEGKLFEGYSFGASREIWEGIEIIRSPLVPRGQGKKQLVLNYLSFALFGSIRGALSCRTPYDGIFVYEISPITVGIPAIVVKQLTGAPIHFWVQDLWPESLASAGGITSEKILGPVDRLTRWIYERCDQILISSKSFKDRIVKQGQDPQKIQYFPQWAEETFKDSDAQLTPEEKAQLPEGFRIVYAGNIGEAQGFETLLDAAEQLKEQAQIQWVILGSGRKAEWVAAEVERRGLQGCFHLLGRKPIESMPAYFKEAGCLLVSLKQDPLFALTLPAKVQAYMAFGAPILAALEGEGAQVVEQSGAGLVAPSGDGPALAQAALEMSQLPEESRQAMAQAAKDYAAKHFERTQLLDWLENHLEAHRA